MDNIVVFQTIVGGLLGGGLISFIQFLIQRKDKKADKNSEILSAIQGLDKKINILDGKIDSVEDKVDERAAVSARVRILRFSDEMLDERKHSKDSYDQCLSDITFYEQYSAEHPNFKNNQTSATIDYIKKSYAERLEKHDFL